MDLLYDAFLQRRLTAGWPRELERMQRWLQREDRPAILFDPDTSTRRALILAALWRARAQDLTFSTDVNLVELLATSEILRKLHCMLRRLAADRGAWTSRPAWQAVSVQCRKSVFDLQRTPSASVP